MERVPSGVKVRILQEAWEPEEEKSLGVDLIVPPRLVSEIRQELFLLMTEPNYHSFFVELVQSFGFVVINLTLLKSQRKSVKNLAHKEASRNYDPLLWHKDGVRNFARFSALFTDPSGPPRLSKTVVSDVGSIFPSLLQSCKYFLEQLTCGGAPDIIIQAWEKAQKKLDYTLQTFHVADHQRQVDIRYAISTLMKALDLSIQECYLSTDDYSQMMIDSLESARGRAYVHQWRRQQTLLVSSEGEFIHSRLPVDKEPGVKGGVLFAKAICR